MRPHATTLLLILVVTAVIAGATGLYPVLIKIAFEAFAARDERLIMVAPIFVIAVTTIKGFALYALTYLTNRVVTRIEADMQAALYAHLIDSDLAHIAHVARLARFDRQRP